MTPILIIPGLGGSGPYHWQTHLERSFPGTTRVHQNDWNRPDRAQWIDRLATAVGAAPGAILVAHSLGCALVAHLATARPELAVGAALLVAPADVDSRDHTPDIIRGFAPVPRRRLTFRSIVVSSSDDPYITLARARELAEAWDAEFVNVGPLGHINVEAGFGPWPRGEQILRDVLAAQRGSQALSAMAANA